jgi:hypothetical protein
MKLLTMLQAAEPGFDSRQEKLLLSPLRQDRLWGPSSLLFNGSSE